MECWIGVDMGESEVSACWVDEKGASLKAWSFANAPEARQSWLEEISSLGVVQLVFESTESFSERLASEAREAGLGVYVVGSSALETFRRSEGYEDKRDDLDARLLGWMGIRRLRTVRPAVQRTHQESTLRGLDRLREQCVAQQVEWGQRLRAMVLSVSPEIAESGSRFPKVTSATFLAVLERWPELTSLHRARSRTVQQCIQRAGRYGAVRAAEIARDLQSWSRHLERLSPSRRQMAVLELGMARESLKLVRQQIQLLEKQMREMVLAHPRGPALLKVHGIGVIVAARLLAEALPRAKTRTEAQMATYSGLTPASRDSGRRKRSRLRRFVNKRLTTAYFESAVSSLRSSPIDRAYYDKKRQDFRGHQAAHTKAVIALARQRHKVIYKILLGEDYDELRLTRSTLERQRQARPAA